jgi:uncharacterized membrane protein/ribosomal protein S27AE
MNSGRLIGIIAMVIALGMAMLTGLFLAQQVGAEALSGGGAIVGAFGAFIIVAPLFAFGAYMYIKGGEEEERESEMEKQRQLLDIVQARGQVDIRNAALELNASVDEVKQMLYNLVGLQVFSGYINWDKGTLYSAEASNLRDLKECENCGASIELAGKGVVACPYCGTEYFLP